MNYLEVKDMKTQFLSVIKFPVFVSIALLIISALVFVLVYQAYGILGWSTWERVLYTGLIVIVAWLVGTWLLILASTTKRSKSKGFRLYLKWMLFHIYYRISRWMNSIFLQRTRDFRESFLNFNNEIILTNYSKIPSNRILLLLPHCLQNSKCKIRVTANIIYCEECGKCDVAALKQISLDNNVQAALASGGSMARKVIKDYKPDVVVAVACHRDLIEGVRDAWRLPVFALLNERPNGPCFETTVNLADVQFALNKFIQ